MASRADIASAFSGHRFEEGVDHLDERVVWDLVGADPVVGRDAVAAVMRSTAEETAAVEVAFSRFRVIDAGDSVVVDTLAEYRDESGISTVASCDVYDFEGDRLVAIRSYATEA